MKIVDHAGHRTNARAVITITGLGDRDRPERANFARNLELKQYRFAIALDGDVDNATFCQYPTAIISRGNIRAGVGRNLPQGAPEAFAEAVVAVDGY